MAKMQSMTHGISPHYLNAQPPRLDRVAFINQKLADYERGRIPCNLEHIAELRQEREEFES